MPVSTADRVSDRADASSLEIRLLGGLSVVYDGKEASLPQSKKTRALLAYLAVTGRAQRRERLCEMFWEVPDDPRAALRWSLSRLRQVIGDALHTTRDSVTLRREGIALDYDRMNRLLPQDLAKVELDDLEGMVALFRGGFIDDLALPRCPDFEAWRTAIANEIELAEIRLRRALVDRLGDQPDRALVHAQALERMSGGDEALAAEVADLAERSRRAALTRNDTGGSGTSVAKKTPPAAAIPQEIRYCTAPDGVRLAFATTGKGYPILKCGNWMSDLQYDRESSVWRHWIAGLSSQNRLIRYDQRGNGLSDRTVDDFSYETQLRDLETVADASGLDRFALLGISAGAGLSVGYAVRHPEKVSHLILYGGRPRGWKHTGTPEDRERRRAMITLIRAGWGQDNPAFRQMFTSLFIPDATPEQMEWYNELQRRTVSPENAARLHDNQGDVRIGHLLKAVNAPTLVLHSEADHLVPFDLGRELAIGIPGARFVALDSRNHILMSHEPAFAQFLEEVHRFVV